MSDKELRLAIESLERREALLNKFMADRLVIKSPYEMRTEEDEIFGFIQMINNLFRAKIINEGEHKELLSRLQDRVAKRGIFFSLPFDIKREV